VHFQPSVRTLLIGAIVILWAAVALLRSYLQLRNKARAEVTADLKKQYGARAKVFVSRPWLLGLRVRIKSPLFGTVGVGSSEETQRALEALRGRIAVKFNPADPSSVQEAIRQYDREVDAKLGPYPQDTMAAETSERLKRHFRQTVDEQVEKFTRAAAAKQR
jgi:hypothetical protein